VPVDLTEFRSTWNNGDVTTHRKHERMHSFFAFCVANDLRRKNPMDALPAASPTILRPGVNPPTYSSSIGNFLDSTKHVKSEARDTRTRRIPLEVHVPHITSSFDYVRIR
jgi:site-specific recombinase XerD